ncbi:hypothetical protein [Streptomyces sp. WAC06614]|uniref:hypothetical protein n=1 Tax=Streptomyces sp. WAC06614 TaxID=2487416 RepID=UPI000F7844E2|nr:hypothetical protein [Streptomyces sp. WAC06614]RSS83719.1 hypothetical protein EF918_02630 [Streptomyces sp. WAC06614]
MWPGQQQPPGGEQNPQNPYQQQPGQPNPYQQPAYGQQQPGYGYPQPGDGQQPPTVQAWGQPPTVPPQAPQPSGGGSMSTRTVAIVAVAAVVVAAAVTGAIVLTQDDEEPQANDKPPASASSPAAPVSSPPAAPTDNPRAGGQLQPVIPGWKVVFNPNYGVAFDVPQEFAVQPATLSTGYEDASKNDGSPLTVMSAPAFFKEDWCKVDSDKNGKEESYALGTTGVKGANGATDTASAARSNAGTWLYAAYAQKQPKEKIQFTQAQEFTTSSGLKGHFVTATVNGLPKEHKCSTTDGKSVSFAFKNAKGDFATWVLFGPTGVSDEIKPDVYQKIMSSIRLSTG